MPNRSRVGRALATAVLLCAGLVAGAAPAGAVGTQGPIETVSTAVDSSNAAGWWSPIERFGNYTFMAYDTDIPGDAPHHNVWVARRNPDGTFLRGCLKTTTGACSVVADDSGHNDPSLHVDGDGYVHVFANMHNNAWIYYRSTTTLDPTTLVNSSSTMPDQGSVFTYPTLSRSPNGDLWLIIRARFGSGNDQTWGEGRLYHWNNATNVWTLATVFAKQSGATVYPDQVTTTADGDVHITYEWCYASAGGLRHQGSYLRYRPSTGTIYTAAGNALSAPATTTTPNVVYRPLAAGETGANDAGDGTTGIGLQTTKLAMHPTGTGYVPIAVYRYRSTTTGNFKVYRATWGTTSWSSAQVYGGEYDTTAALSITDDGITKRIYYVKKDTVETNNAWVSESVDAGPFTERALAPGKAIHRLSVVPTSDGTDQIYLTTANGPNSGPPGQLYYTTLTR
ncbi:MAG: BNR-4 repeat-containing protein [Jatrophihabitans sp.]